jgi:hypothetical protein
MTAMHLFPSPNSTDDWQRRHPIFWWYLSYDSNVNCALPTGQTGGPAPAVTRRKFSELALAVDRFGAVIAGFRCVLARNDAAKWPQAEEALPAGVTTVGGKPRKPFREKHCTFVNALSGDAVEIKISAFRAMSQMNEGQRHSLGIESKFASFAAPRTATRERVKKIDGPRAAGTKTLCAAALRTDQGLTPK